MACHKCIAPKYTGPREACIQFVGFHGHCHSCGYTWLMHKGDARKRISDKDNFGRALDHINDKHGSTLSRLSDVPRPVLTVIDGGAKDEDCWSAWLSGEDHDG